MSRQLSIDNFFTKSKNSVMKTPSSCNTSEIMSEFNRQKTSKKRLSLVKNSHILTKSPKVEIKDKCVDDIIDLVSDDEDNANTPKSEVVFTKQLQNTPSGQTLCSDTSDDTITYSLTPETRIKSEDYGSPQTSRTSSISNTTPSVFTPIKSSPIRNQQSQNGRTPNSRTKFFSPTKNRMVSKRPTGNVRRDLNAVLSKKQLDDCSGSASVNTGIDLFSEACRDMDDKTIFLLSIINKCLNVASLRNLMDIESQELLGRCFHIVKPGMKLVSKLYWRKEGWFKREEINRICSKDKEEKKLLDDQSFELMMESLEKSKLIVKGDSSSTTFDDYTRMLNRDDCVQICKDLKINITSKKDAIENLRNFSKRKSNISNFFTGYTSDNSKRVIKIMSEKVGPCYKLADSARRTIYKLHILMYLGMDYTIIRDKKLEFVLLYDKIERETYPVDKNMVLDNASIIFSRREDFERYVTAHDIYEDFLNRTDVMERCAIVNNVFDLYRSISQEEIIRYKNLQRWLRRYTPAYKYVKILEAGIQDLKKDKNGGQLLALEILKTLINQDMFRQHKKAEWYAEQALILHSLLNRFDEAAEVLLEGFTSSMSEEAKDAMRARARKIATQRSAPVSDHLRQQLMTHATTDNIEGKLPSEHIYKQPMERSEKRGKIKFETRTPEFRLVQEAEEYCIGHYIASGEFTDGEHWEGRIVTTIFFLLFWDIVYSQPPGVRGVFLSYYQLYPLDLFCESFYINRKKAIDDWLDVIEKATEDKLINIMHETWVKRPENEVSGIVRTIGWEKIKMVATCLGPRGLAAICRRLAQNYHYTHSGFPDLTLWNKNTKRIKFVEVKTDTDKPSMKQIQWMFYLRENGIETEFCYVGVNTTRQRCRMAQGSPKKHKKRRAKKEPNSSSPKKKVKSENEKTPKKKTTKAKVTPNVQIKNEPQEVNPTSQNILMSEDRNTHTEGNSIGSNIMIKEEPREMEERNSRLSKVTTNKLPSPELHREKKTGFQANLEDLKLKVKEEIHEMEKKQVTNVADSQNSSNSTKKLESDVKLELEKDSQETQNIRMRLRITYEDEEESLGKYNSFQTEEKIDLNATVSPKSNNTINKLQNNIQLESIHSQQTQVVRLGSEITYEEEKEKCRKTKSFQIEEEEVKAAVSPKSHNTTYKLQSNKQLDLIHSQQTQIVRMGSRITYDEEEENCSIINSYQVRHRGENDKENHGEKCSPHKSEMFHSINSQDTVILTPLQQPNSDDTLQNIDCDCGETLHLFWNK